MIFNPEESIDLHGFTATSIQYTHARIRSVLRNENAKPSDPPTLPLTVLEKELVILLEKYPTVIEDACQEMNPSLLAVYAYEVAKKFNSFYDAHSILKAESIEKKELRLKISQMTANVIASAMQLLGINVPQKM